MGTARELVALSGSWPGQIETVSTVPLLLPILVLCGGTVWRSEFGRTSVQLQRLEVLCDFFGHSEALVLSSIKLEL